MRTLIWALAPLALWLGVVTTPAAAEPAAGIQPGNVLILFDTATPQTVTSHAITGLGANETVRGIDTRPATGGVYISTVTTGSAANSVIKTYTLDTNTGAATLVGETVALAGAGDVPTGYDFSPSADVIRYVNTNDEDARLNATSGALTANDTDLTPAATTTIIATAFDRNHPGGLTTQFEIDRNDGALARQGGVDGTPSPNGGVVTDIASLGFNLNQANDGGFDISHSGTAYAALTDAADNLTRLYTINLAGMSNVASPVGLIANGQTEVRSFAILDADSDADTVVNRLDNCAFVANTDQANNDGDAQGDACDDDDDNDGLPDSAEIAALGLSPFSADSDGDGVADGADQCPRVPAATASGCNENPPPAAALVPLGFTITGFPSKITLKRLRTKGVSLRVEPNAASSFLAELRGNKGLRKASAGDIVLAETRLASATGKRTIRLKVPRSQRKRLKRKASLRLLVTATDALGRSVTRRRTLKIR